MEFVVNYDSLRRFAERQLEFNGVFVKDVSMTYRAGKDEMAPKSDNTQNQQDPAYYINLGYSRMYRGWKIFTQDGVHVNGSDDYNTELEQVMYLVQGQKNKHYIVAWSGGAEWSLCNCRDAFHKSAYHDSAEKNKQGSNNTCKHIYAVMFYRSRQTMLQGEKAKGELLLRHPILEGNPTWNELTSSIIEADIDNPANKIFENRVTNAAVMMEAVVIRDMIGIQNGDSEIAQINNLHFPDMDYRERYNYFMEQRPVLQYASYGAVEACGDNRFMEYIHNSLPRAQLNAPQEGVPQ